MNIVCVIRGHVLTHTTYRGATQMWTPPTWSRDLYGRYEYHKPVTTGFTHYGLVSTCERCGNQIDADDLDLPIMEPNFDETI